MDMAVPSPQMAEVPGETVTLLFTDIVGSTPLLHKLGEAYRSLQNPRIAAAAQQNSDNGRCLG
jgi:class 3 adenylate cyclase